MLIAVMVVTNFWVIEVCYLKVEMPKADQIQWRVLDGAVAAWAGEGSTTGTECRNMQGA